MDLQNWWNSGKTGLVQTLNGEIRRTTLGSKYSRFRIAYVE